MWRILYFTQLAGAQLGEGDGDRSPLPFFQNQKKRPDFRKKGPDCVHRYIKFAIQNIVVRVLKKKNFEILFYGAFLLEFLTKCLLECRNFTKPPLPWKYSGCVPGWQGNMDYLEHSFTFKQIFAASLNISRYRLVIKSNLIYFSKNVRELS